MSLTRNRVVFALPFAWLCASSAAGDDFVDFEKHIRPVLIERCYSCHSAESEKLRGGLYLDTPKGALAGGHSGDPAIIPGDAENSPLIRALRWDDEELQMPPKEKLADLEIQRFVDWVNDGAPDPRGESGTPGTTPLSMEEKREFWSFAPPVEPPLPEVENRDWPRTPIDRFVLSKLETKGISPAPETDKRTLIRRATYDLIGLPPTFEEVEAFEKDARPDAYARLIDRLLDSPHYGERWGRYWLDVARYADTKGYVYGGREEARFVHSHTYRDWVVSALNRDLPYDRFLLLQIAADQVVGASDREDLAAMGFLTLGRRFLGVTHDIIDDRIDTLMRGTQGLTVSCARCHDHKFDPIPTEDYYSLYGVFAGSSERLVALDPESSETEEEKKFWEEHQARLGKQRETFEAKREEFEDRARDRVGDYLLALLDVENLPNEEFYEIRQADEINPTVVRQWQSYLFGCGENDPVFGPWNRLASFFEERVPDFVTAVVGKKALPPLEPPAAIPVNPIVAEALSKASPKSMLEVADVYTGVLTDVHRRWRAIISPLEEAESPAPDRFPDPALEEIRRALYGSKSPTRVPDGAIVDLEWFFDEPTRVALGKLQKEIDAGIVDAACHPPFAVTLADRPTQKNPRVFLRGNPANKGKEVPRRLPALLAHEDRAPFAKGSGRLELARAIASRENPLTARVMVNRVWAHHFGKGLVTTPSDLGTRSAPPSHPELLDWLAARFMEEGWSLKKLHRRIMLSSVYRQTSDRATARDGLKSSSGTEEVDPENTLYWRFDRSRLDFEPLRDSVLFVSGDLDDRIGGAPTPFTQRPFMSRRSLYGTIDRQFVPGLLRVFDFPNPDMHNPRRHDTTVPQQALFFMNSPFMQERARALAARVEATGETFVPGKAESLYRLAYQRDPNENEVGFAREYVENCIVEPPPEPPPPNLSDWSYGYGKFATEENRVVGFEPLPHFTGEALQGGSKWPDDKLGWVQLTARGGHPGNDPEHAAIRRWTSPATGTISIEGTLEHEEESGNGVRARVVSSRLGSRGEWTAHNGTSKTRFEKIPVGAGDTIDFVVDIFDHLNHDEFEWVVGIELSKTPRGGNDREWNSEKDFSGPLDPVPVPLTSWEKYAQALLSSNEFLFVD